MKNLYRTSIEVEVEVKVQNIKMNGLSSPLTKMSRPRRLNPIASIAKKPIAITRLSNKLCRRTRPKYESNTRGNDLTKGRNLLDRVLVLSRGNCRENGSVCIGSSLY